MKISNKITKNTNYTNFTNLIYYTNLFFLGKEILSKDIDDKTYKGKNGYVIYAEKSAKDLERYKLTGSLGPMRAPSNIRVSCRFDYAPGICKDYKETGYCGFGDGCVFMHDRGDYKTGWELEEEYKQQKHKEDLFKRGLLQEESDEDYEVLDEDNYPLECQRCNKEFKSPIVTK